MKKTDKKAFTIVELVIVIAVIAILIAVLIPTFSKIIGKANESNDTQIVRQLNTAIEIESVTAKTGKPVAMHDANEMVKPYGLDVEGLATKSNLSIAWDCENHRFVLLNEKDNNYVFPVDASHSEEGPIPENEKVNYFLIRKSLPGDTNKYSIYAASGSEWTTTKVENLTVGLDVGNRTDITSITYNRSSESEQKVVIRTNGGVLKINAPFDTVTRCGFATEVYCNDVKKGTYNEAGTAGRLIYSDKNGAIKFKPTAEVYCYMNTSDDPSADATEATKEQGAVVYSNVKSEDKNNAYGYVEDKVEVTVKDGIVEIVSCKNHNTDYGVVVVGNKEYILCKCCGGFSLYEDGNKAVLSENDPRKHAEIPTVSSGAETGSNFDYTSPNHEHTFAEAWSKDEASHWHASACEHTNLVNDQASHTFGEATVVSSATCTEKGTKKSICTVCGYEKIEEIPALNHSYQDDFLSNDAGHWHKCERCDATTSQEAHTLTYSNNTGDTHDVSCSVCGYSQTGIAHTFTNGTCICGKEEVTEIIRETKYINSADSYNNNHVLTYNITPTTISSYDVAPNICLELATLDGNQSTRTWMNFAVFGDNFILNGPGSNAAISLHINDTTGQNYQMSSGLLGDSTILYIVDKDYKLERNNSGQYFFTKLGQQFEDNSFAVNPAPLITDSDDFKDYLISIADISGYTSAASSITKANINNYISAYKAGNLGNKTFAEYLKDKYGVGDLRNIPYKDIISDPKTLSYGSNSYYYNKTGIAAGNEFGISHVEPELIQMLYYSFYTNNMAFAFFEGDAVTSNPGLSDWVSFIESEYKDYGREDWMQHYSTTNMKLISCKDAMAIDNPYKFKTDNGTIIGCVCVVWNKWIGTNAYQGVDFFVPSVMNVTFTPSD